MKPLKSVVIYYTKGFFTASGLLILMNLPEFNLVGIIQQSLMLGIGLALLINALEEAHKIK
jgi:hypothetical protein